jgi:hypothetical protein
MKIFGVDPVKDINWYLVWYIIGSIVVIFYGTKTLFATNYEARAVIYGIGSTLITIYFGLRFFAPKNMAKPGSWPPVINMCPDYLTYAPNVPGCVDMLGVTSNAAGLSRTLPTEVNNLQMGNTNKIFEFTSEDVKKATNTGDLQKICNRCKSAGVTWEGVYDGDSCSAISSLSAKIASAAGGPGVCLVNSSDIGAMVSEFRKI